MSSTSNPYAPPKDGPFVAPPPPLSEEGVITCTVVLTEASVASGLLLTAKKIQWIAPIALGTAGFIGTSFVGPGLQVLVALGCAAFGWFVAPKVLLINAGRALANKSEAERTFTWRFSAEGYEVTAAASYSRANWSVLHRFVEGPTTFVLYASEAVVHVIPKDRLRPEEVPALRAMFTSRIIPRKKPFARGLVWVAVLWALLVLMFLAIWQFLQAQP